MFAFFGQDLFCHKCCGSMRNGIMHMKQLKIVILDHINHCTRQSGLIRRIIEQWISGYLYLVIKNIRNKTIQPYRLLVSNKMHQVSFLGKRLTQFSCENTTSTKCGITDDSYTHYKNKFKLSEVRSMANGRWPKLPQNVKPFQYCGSPGQRPLVIGHRLRHLR